MVNATPRPLYSRERPGARYIEGWTGPKAGPDGRGKSRPVQTVASRYTDYAILARRRSEYSCLMYNSSVPVAALSKA